MNARKTALVALGAAFLATVIGCTKTAPTADRFPGFSQAGPTGADARWFVDLSSVTRASGAVSFKAVRVLDAGYAIQGVETDCQSRVLGHEGVRFKDDGTTDRVFDADKTTLDIKDVPGAAAATKLACDKATAGRVITGDFDDAKALQLLFGNYSAADKTAIWKDFSSTSADTQFLKDGQPVVRVALSSQYVEGGTTKHVLVTTATPNVTDYDCHACGVLLGAFVFVNDAGKWRVSQELPYFQVGGSWGKPPSLALIKLSDAAVALHIESGYMGQGILSSSHQLFLLKPASQPIFDYSVEGDSESHNPAATIEALPSVAGGLADIRVNVVWSGVDASAPSSSEQIVYRYDGQKYQRSTPTSPADTSPAAAASSTSAAASEATSN